MRFAVSCNGIAGCSISELYDSWIYVSVCATFCSNASGDVRSNPPEYWHLGY